MHSFFVYTRKQTKREHTSVPSGRWQSCPVQEIWPPFAAVGTMPPVSPSLSPPKSFPHRPAGTEGKTEREEMSVRTAEVFYHGVIQGRLG